jgi:hypothetical protein
MCGRAGHGHGHGLRMTWARYGQGMLQGCVGHEQGMDRAFAAAKGMCRVWAGHNVGHVAGHVARLRRAWAGHG